MRRGAVAVALLAVAAVVLWPLARQPPRDSFPLSTYPMFTQLRPRVATVELAVGVDPSGADVRLAPDLVGGTVEVIHAAATVRRSIAEGAAPQLCHEIAQRVVVARRTLVVEVLVASDAYDVVEALVAGEGPRHRQVHARCPVPW